MLIKRSCNIDYCFCCFHAITTTLIFMLHTSLTQYYFICSLFFAFAHFLQHNINNFPVQVLVSHPTPFKLTCPLHSEVIAMVAVISTGLAPSLYPTVYFIGTTNTVSKLHFKLTALLVSCKSFWEVEKDAQ